MSKTLLLRCFINQRLNAAADEIFGAVERAMAEYEGKVHILNLEIERQSKMLTFGVDPRTRITLLRADPEQFTLSLCNKEVPERHHSEQERSPNVDQEDPQPPQIKEEPKVVWTGQGGSQLQGMEEEVEQQLLWLEEEKDTKDSLFPESSVHRETDQVITHSWEHTDNVLFPCTSTGQRTSDPNGEGCEQEDPNIGCLLLSEDGSVAEKGDGIIDDENGRPRSGPERHGVKRKPTDKYRKYTRLTCLKSERCDIFTPTNKGSLIGHFHKNAGQHVCKLCGKSFTRSNSLKRHLIIHTGEKPHKCSVCGNQYNRSSSLKRHRNRHLLHMSNIVVYNELTV